jgi:hypothetical protein
MKNTIQHSLLSLVLATALTAGAFAQTVVREETSTTNSAGTITEFGPESIVIRSETAPQPIRYISRKTTTYVDDAGAPVSIETVKSGLPVTVYYTQEGGQMVASRVVVRRATTVTPVVPTAPVIEKKTTTTTTTTTGKERKEKDDKD